MPIINRKNNLKRNRKDKLNTSAIKHKINQTRVQSRKVFEITKKRKRKLQRCSRKNIFK